MSGKKKSSLFNVGSLRKSPPWYGWKDLFPGRAHSVCKLRDQLASLG